MRRLERQYGPALSAVMATVLLLAVGVARFYGPVATATERGAAAAGHAR